MGTRNHQTEEGSHSKVAPLEISIGIVPPKEDKGIKEIANSQHASVFPHEMTIQWTPRQLHEKRIPTRKRRSTAKQGDASNVANKATSCMFAPPRKIG